MSDCKDCKGGILNKQTSKIGNPECNGDCPEEAVCTGISTYTDCVLSNVALSCINTEIGATQTAINQAIDEALCSVGNSCNTWTELTNSNLGLAAGWTWAQSGFEKPAISNVKGCIVRLAGTVTKSAFVSSGAITIGTLPVGKRPVNIRRFTVNFTTSQSYPLNIIPSFLTIKPTGEMTINNPYGLGALDHPTVSLDGISFETNTII